MGGRLTPPSTVTSTRGSAGRYARSPARTRSPSARVQSRKSTESEALSGTTFVTVPDAATVGTTEVPDGRSASASANSAKRDISRRAEAPFSGSSPACAATPEKRAVTRPTPFRAIFAAPPSPDGSRTKTRSRFRASATRRSREAQRPDLLVRRQEEREARGRGHVAARDGLEDGDGDRDAPLHVEDAGPAGDAGLDAKRNPRQRAGGPDRVEVAEEKRAPALGADPREEGVSAARAGHARGRDSGGPESRGDPAREAADEGGLIGRALAHDEGLEVGEHRIPALEKQRGEVADARAHARSSWIPVVTRERTSGRIATPMPGPSARA